jgi:hypothetical protein
MLTPSWRFTVARMSKSEPEQRLVEQHEARPQHERAADRKHLLLAARERAGLLEAPLFENREIPVHALDVGCDAQSIATAHGAELQVLLHGHSGESSPPLRHVRNAEPHHILGRAAGDRLSVEHHLAGGADHSAQGAERRRLAGAVGAQKCRDATLLDGKIEPVQDLDVTVGSAQITNVEQDRHAAASPR